MRDAEIVVSLVVFRVFCDGALEINETACRVTLREQVTALVKCLLSFAGHSQILHGNNIVALRHSRLLGLCETCGGGNQDAFKKKTAESASAAGSFERDVRRRGRCP